MSEKTKSCHKCGSLNKIDYKKCRDCGADLRTNYSVSSGAFKGKEILQTKKNIDKKLIKNEFGKSFKLLFSKN